MPDLENEEVQEEFGWENLSAQDDGRRDMAIDHNLEPDAATEGQQTAETDGEPPQDQQRFSDVAQATAVQPEGQQETPAETEEAPPQDEVVFTLPGGKKVTKAELIADEKLLGNLVTHSNQLSHFQRLAEERKAQADEAQAEARRVLDQFTMQQMHAQQAQQAQQEQQQQEQRPPSQALEAMYAPHLDKLVEDGRLTQDHRQEFGPLIAEHMYDMQQIRNMLGAVYQAGLQEFGQIYQTLEQDVVPDVTQFRTQWAVQADQQVQQEVATISGYEGLADQNEWNRLKSFIQEKVNASPRLPNGRPSFDPQFDAVTMAQMYDAMTGADLRAQIAAEKARLEQQANQTTNLVGGETAAKAGGAPPPKQPAQMTPEQDAMDFGTPTMATG